MTNDAHLDGLGADERSAHVPHRSDFPLRLVRLDDGRSEVAPERTAGEAQAETTDPARGHGAPRVQPVLLGRASRGRVQGGHVQRCVVAGFERFYAYGRTSDTGVHRERVALGVFASRSEAEQAVTAFAASYEVASHDQTVDVAGWVADWCDALSEERRRELFDDPRSPILASWYRIGSPPLTERHMAALFGLTHQRINQIERSARSHPRVRKALASYAGHGGDAWDHWDQIRSMGDV